METRARRRTGHPRKAYARGGARGRVVPAVGGLARAETLANAGRRIARSSSGSKSVLAGSWARARVRSEDGLTGAWKTGCPWPSSSGRGETLDPGVPVSDADSVSSWEWWLASACPTACPISQTGSTEPARSRSATETKRDARDLNTWETIARKHREWQIGSQILALPRRGSYQSGLARRITQRKPASTAPVRGRRLTAATPPPPSVME